jgi:TolB-like protein/DNA-binding winged helix-turn-helix (wHTH) protein
MKHLTEGLRQRIVEFAGFRLDPKKRQFTMLDGTAVTLHSRAFDTLLALVSRQGELVTKQELLEAVWPGVVVDENNLNQAISALRKAFGDSWGRDSIIKTIPGRGYCFVADVRFVEEAPSETATEPVAEAAAPVAPRGMDWRKAIVLLAAGFSVTVVTVVLIQPTASVRMPPATPPASALPVTPPEANDPARPQALPNSIAVLPFSTADADPEQALFGQGLHDEILTQLGRVSNLNVISRNTMLQYRNTTKTPADIARELNVAVILEGSARAAGNVLRISLQMIDPLTNVSLWTSTYDVDMQDIDQIFALQADIATNVARTLQAELLPREMQQVAMVPTNSPAAYKLFLEAAAALVPGDYAQALHLLEQAVEVDPDFIAAWSELSTLNTLMTGIPEQSSAVHQQQALDAARRALAINDDYAMAHVAMAAVQHNAGEWEMAAREYTLARNLGAPLDTSPMYALFQLSVADFEGGRITLQQNLAIDPINLISRGFLMIAHEYLGDTVSSRAEYAKGEAMYADWWGDNTGIWLALGRRDTVYLDKSLQEFPDYALREVLEIHGQKDEAIAWLQQILQRNADYKPGQLLNAAMFAAYYDEAALALELLRAGLRDNWVSFYLVWLPVFDELRSSPAFKEFLSQSGMTAYWQQNGWPQACRRIADDDIDCGR